MRRLLLLLLPLALLGSCHKLKLWQAADPQPTISAVEVEQRRQALIARVAALPAYLVHEGSPASFQQQLRRGDFCHDSVRGTSYLSINGDGSFGRRVFIAHRDGSLNVKMHEDGRTELYRYNAKEQCLEELSVTLMPLGDE